jgi:hypothetical protein
MPDELPEPIELETAWIGADDLPVHFANAFTGVVGPTAVFITIGSQVPPAIESREDAERLRATGFVPLRPIARIALTPQGLDDMIESLENTRTNYQNVLSAIKAQGEQS